LFEKYSTDYKVGITIGQSFDTCTYTIVDHEIFLIPLMVIYSMTLMEVTCKAVVTRQLLTGNKYKILDPTNRQGYLRNIWLAGGDRNERVNEMKVFLHELIEISA
jgi:hypothetical protein